MPRSIRSRSSSEETSPRRTHKKHGRSRRHRRVSEQRRSRSRSRESSVKQALSAIVSRLNAIEEYTASRSLTPVPPNRAITPQRDYRDDDVLLMSMTVADGTILLREVLETLTQAGFSINLRKCSFLTTEVEYLGRIISHGQVRPNPNKIEALTNTPVPSNVKQVRQFLGLAGYFRRYIEGYATKTASISRLTKKKQPL